MPEQRMIQSSAHQRPSLSPSPRPHSGTVLAIDFGERRLGIAVGEASLGSAHPLPQLAATGDARWQAIARLVEEWQPVACVVGLPVADTGGQHALEARVRAFAQALGKRFGLPVSLVDERYSSVEAESRMREAAGARHAAKASRERRIDSYAAQLILEQYFSQSSPAQAA